MSTTKDLNYFYHSFCDFLHKCSIFYSMSSTFLNGFSLQFQKSFEQRRNISTPVIFLAIDINETNQVLQIYESFVVQID